MLYTQLYNSVKGARKKLSYETYDIHLSHLKENGLVEKTTKGYSCSDRAYFLYGLKILDFNRPNKTFLDPMESEDMEHRLKYSVLLRQLEGFLSFAKQGAI